MIRHNVHIAQLLASQELQRCLGRVERNGCNDLQSLIWATQEH